MANKEITRLVKTLEKQGFKVKRGGTGHYKAYKDDRLISSFSATPSDHHALKHIKKYLVQAGATF